MSRALLAESVPGALEDRKNWAFEAFAFDALAVLATVAVAIRAVRTNGAEIQPARKASCQSKCVVGFRIAAATLMALAPVIALIGDYSSWSVHLADQILLFATGIAHLVCATLLALRRKGEGAAARWLWSVALVGMLPRLASSTAYGSDEERGAAWTLALGVFLYLCGTLTPPSGLTGSHEALDADSVPDNEAGGAIRNRDSRRSHRKSRSGSGAVPVAALAVDASSPLQSAGPARLGGGGGGLEQGLLAGADLGSTDPITRVRAQSGRRKAVSFAEGAVAGANSGRYGTSGRIDRRSMSGRGSSFAGGWEAADQAKWSAASPFAEGTPPVIGLQGLRVMTGGCRAWGLLILAWKLQDSLDAAASVEAGHAIPQSTWTNWTLTQSSVLMLASLLLPLPACLAACMSAPRDDATGTARMVHLAEAWVASVLVAGGPGAVLTGLLWSLSGDGTLPEMGYEPWLIAGPLAIQSTLAGMMLMVLVIALLVTESRPAWNIILAFLACALLITSAILLPVLPAARLEPLTRSNATDEGGSLSWVATAVPAYLLSVLLTVGLLATEQLADAGVGAWTPLRFDSLVVLGYGTTALLLALAMDAGMQLPSREHPLGVSATDPLASPLLIALPALLCQCTCLVVDTLILLLQGLAACDVLSIEPDVYRGTAPVGGVFASDGVGGVTGGSTTREDRGWGPFLMLDDSLMANIALDFAVADGAVAGVGKTARRGSSGRRTSAAAAAAAAAAATTGRRDRAGSGRPAHDGRQVDDADVDDDDGDDYDMMGGSKRNTRRGSSSQRRRAAGQAAGLDGGRAFHRQSTDRAVSGDGQASRQLTYEGAGEGVGVSQAGETVGSVQQERRARGASGAMGSDPHAEKALEARRRVIALRQNGVVMTEWRGEDVAAWLEAVVGWVDLAETAAVGLASRACDDEAEGSVLMRLWLRGRSSGGRWADLEEAVGCGRGGIDVLVRSLVGEAGARPQADNVKWDGTPVAKTQSAHGHTGTGGAAAVAAAGTKDDDDDDDDDDSWGFDGEDELAFTAADDDALERVLRLARGAARRYEGGAVAASKAEARSARERRLARMPRAWPSTVWLAQVGLPQLAPQFERAGITPERLASMRKTSDFAKIGIESRLYQRSLRAGVMFLRRHHFDLKGEIAELRREKWLPRPVLPDHLPAWTNREVVAWLRTSLPLDQEKHARQIEKLRQSGLHGALLFTRRPFNPNAVLAGFGLTRSSARSALVSRITAELRALGHTGASAAVAARSAARGGAEASAMARRPRASSATAAVSGGGSEAGRVEGKDDERVRRPSSTGTGDSGGGATSGGGTRSSFRRESVASASAFEAAFSPEALAAMVPTAANDAVLAADALAAIGSSDSHTGRRKSGMLGAFALPGLTGPNRKPDTDT